MGDSENPPEKRRYTSDDDLMETRGTVYRRSIWDIFTFPSKWFHDKVAVPMHEKNPYVYYHRRFRRVPDVDQCYEGDPLCLYEANEQFRRDRAVEENICHLLRKRYEECVHWYGTGFAESFKYDSGEAMEKCTQLKDIYDEAAGAYFCKYGDLGWPGDVTTAYMKQKHRMIWERRHGPVGAGHSDKYNVGTPLTWRVWNMQNKFYNRPLASDDDRSFKR